jgi:6-phosphogluconolactonase
MIKLILLSVVLFNFKIAYTQKTVVFFGSFNRDKTTEGIYVYELDTLSGEMNKVSSIKNISNPSFLTISPDGNFIYSCTESKTENAGSVSSFKFNLEEKSLTFINSQKSGGENPVYVTVHQNSKWLVNGNYTEGSISVFPLLENGNIDSAVQVLTFEKGVSHIHSTIFSPDYKYLLATDLGTDQIKVYSFEPSLKEVLNLKSITNTTKKSGPRHLTFHPNGKFIYCIEELSGTISSFIVNKGELESLQTISTHKKNAKGAFESSDIHISPDGKFLYASNRGIENKIASFSINADGTLTFLEYSSVHGKHPRTFAIDPTGNILLVTNVTTGNVTSFKRNKETGKLKKVSNKLKIRNVSCVQIRQYP